MINDHAALEQRAEEAALWLFGLPEAEAAIMLQGLLDGFADGARMRWPGLGERDGDELVLNFKCEILACLLDLQHRTHGITGHA